MNTPENTKESACCDNAFGEGTNDIPGREHDGECDNYDGAPYHQWEVTEPAEVYWTDDYLSQYDDDPNPYHGDYSEM